MQKVLTAEQMREVDRLTTEKYGIPSILLMENAAHAAARVIIEKLGGSVKGKSVLVLCGKGNNGGDGAALARILGEQGAVGTVLLFGRVRDTKGDARTNFEIARKLGKRGYPFEFMDCGKNSYKQIFHTTFFQGTWSPYTIVIDALFGTGLTRPLDANFSYIVELVSEKQRSKQRRNDFLLVSLDIPSGLKADSAERVGENIHADMTITLSAPKLANVMSPASHFNGELSIGDIGSSSLIRDLTPETLVVSEDGIRGFLCRTQVQSDSYKKSRGSALIVAGSENYSGAAVLAANACFAAGTGMVSVAVPKTIKGIVAKKVLDEVIVKTLEQDVILNVSANVVAIGCGLSPDESMRSLVHDTVSTRRTPVVLDAEALNALSPFELKGSKALPLILTPHIGEFKRLLGSEGEINDTISSVRTFAQKHTVILVLKGARVLTGTPDGRVYINPTGNAGVSRAGAGDTLTGVITGLLAQALAVSGSDLNERKTTLDKIIEAVISAIYIAGIAGDIAAEKFGQRLMMPSDIRDCLGEAMTKIDYREAVRV